MSPQLSDPLSVTFSALADPTRRAILARLARGETSVGDLVKPFAISGAAISRHLRVLENARLIERKVNAQWRICRLNPPGLRLADSWLSPYRAFWEQSLDRLIEVLEQVDGPPAAPTGSSATSPRSTRRPRGVRPPDGARRAPLTRKKKSS
ncbi:MAG: metalloregulator ArsR/SmtB family transcription factor [Comamonadaceae bacterium]